MSVAREIFLLKNKNFEIQNVIFFHHLLFADEKTLSWKD